MTTEAAVSRAPGGLEIVRRIGVGGSGEVFEAVRIAPGGVRKPVAIKRLSVALAPSDEARARFLREARISALLDHPNIVRVYDFVLDEGTPLLVMELLRGKTLYSLVRDHASTGGVLPSWVALSIVDQALAGLEYAHELRNEQGMPLGLVHRDITPSNIFVCDDGLVKLLDFGLAKTATLVSVHTQQMQGTLEYLPPERWRGEPAQARSDLYQLGASLYFALSGRSPVGSGGPDVLRSRALEGRHAPLPSQSDASAATLEIVERALRGDVAERFADAGAMRSAVIDALRSDYASSLEPLARWIAKESADTAIRPRVVDGEQDEAQTEAHATSIDGPARVGSNEVDVEASTIGAPTESPPASSYGLPSRFEVRGVIAEGGMGVVLDARDRTLDRDVAVKLISAEHRGNPEMRTRLLREARLAATLHHRRIVAVYDVDPEGRFIVMERMRGETLAQRIKRVGRLPVSDVRSIGRALLDALAEAHARGIVHRDVKPSNILFDEEGEPHLADFGVARGQDSDLTHSGARVGTPAYMAPEQLRANVVDARADLYAVGATLYEAATGRRLHIDGARDEDPLATVLAVTGDEFLACAIAASVEDKRGDRFADAQSFINALDGSPITRRVDPPSPAGTPPTGLVAPSIDAPRRLAGDTSRIETTTVPTARLRRSWASWVAIVASVVIVGAGGAILMRATRGDVALDVSRPARARASASALPASAASSDVVIACLPFEVQSTRSDLGYARSAFPHLLAEGLARAPAISLKTDSTRSRQVRLAQTEDHAPLASVIGYHRLAERVTDPNAAPSAWIEAARALGATVLAHGSITDVDAQHLRVRIWLTDLAGKELYTTTSDTTVDQIASTVEGVVANVAGAAREGVVAAAEQHARQDTRLMLAQGIAKLQAHSFSEAEGLLRATVDQAPHNVDARYYYVISGWWADKPPAEMDARILAAQHEGLDPERVAVLRGLERIALNDYPGVIDDFARLAHSPNPSVDVLYGQFEALFHGGRPAEAMQVFRRLVGRDPGFAIGVIHPLGYYAARGDQEGMAWAIEIGRVIGESSTRTWMLRAYVGRGQYDRALQQGEDIAEHAGDRPDVQAVLYREIAWVHMVQGRASLADAVIRNAMVDDDVWQARAELALAESRGASPTERTLAFDEAFRLATAQPPEAGLRMTALTELAAIILPTTRPSELAAVDDALKQAMLPEQAGSLRVHVLQALLAGARHDAARLHAMRASPFPEAVAIANAFELEAAHRRPEAAAAWATAIDDSGTGKHYNSEWYFLARLHHDAGDAAATAAACAHVFTPHVVEWDWPFAASQCRAWSH